MKELQRAAMLALLAGVAFAQLPNLKPGWNLFSKEQDIQLGREAAAEVEKKSQVINNPELTAYVQRVGTKLASQPQAGGFPYSFKVVNDSSINAFALPGGPTFVNIGLLRAVDNESQLAGVLAHEISHVALRHGTHQASTANAIQIPAALAGAILGRSGGLLGSVAQLGVGLGANSVLLKFSRTAEQQADELGVQIMSSAGYNPLELAHFFEKLEAQGGSRTLQFLSDHPNPGNRVKYIEDEIRYLPQRPYNAETGELPRIKEVLNRLPKAPEKAATGQIGAPAAMRPSSSMKEFRSQSFVIGYPDNWETFGDQGGSTVTIAPRSALVQTKSGGVQVGYGAILSFYMPQGDRLDLQRDTDGLISQLRSANPSIQVSRQGSREIRVDGQKGLVTEMTSASPFSGEEERDLLVTVPRPEGLFYAILLAPQDETRSAQPAFDSMIRSIRFTSR